MVKYFFSIGISIVLARCWHAVVRGRWACKGDLERHVKKMKGWNPADRADELWPSYTAHLIERNLIDDRRRFMASDDGVIIVDLFFPRWTFQ